MIGLTKKQRELFDFIESYMARNNGVAPSFEEMASAVGLSAKSGVHRLLTGLEERGFVRRIPHRARALEINRDGHPPANPLSAYSIPDLVAELASRGWFGRRAA